MITKLYFLPVFCKEVLIKQNENSTSVFGKIYFWIII